MIKGDGVFREGSDEVTEEHHKREEATYGRLLFRFLLAAIAIGVAFGVYDLNIFGHTNLYISTLNQIRVFRRLSLFSALLGSGIPGLLATVAVIGSLLAYIRVFYPSWVSTPWVSTSTKIHWRHLFRWMKSSIRVAVSQLITGIVLSLFLSGIPFGQQPRNAVQFIAISLASSFGIWLTAKLFRYKSGYIHTLLGSLIGTIPALMVSLAHRSGFLPGFPGGVAFFVMVVLPNCTAVLNVHLGFLKMHWEGIRLSPRDTICALPIVLVPILSMLLLLYGYELRRSVAQLGMVAGTLACMILGTLFWLIYSREGMLSTPGKIRVPPSGQAVRIGLHGALAGGLISIAIQSGVWMSGEFFDFLWGSLAYLESNAEVVAGPTLTFCWVGVVVGTVLFALARPDISLQQRLRASLLGWIAGLVGLIVGVLYYDHVMVSKYDHGRDLAEVVGVSKTALSGKTVVLFTGDERPVVIRKPLLHSGQKVGLYKASGIEYTYTLDAGKQSVQKAIDYVAHRKYETSLLSECNGYIQDALRLNWDLDALTEWLYTVAKSGSPLVTEGVMGFTSYIRIFSPSPNRLQWLQDIAADATLHFTATGCEQMGDAYWSFARREDALHWYRRAGLSPPLSGPGPLYDPERSQQRLREMGSTPLPFIQGIMEGRIVVNDRHFPDIGVGIWSPAHLRSKPGDVNLSMEVDRNVRAFTETDLEGVFRLEYLREGEYRFAIMADETLIPADETTLKVVNAPDTMVLNAQHPTVDLGEIHIVVAR